MSQHTRFSTIALASIFSLTSCGTKSSGPGEHQAGRPQIDLTNPTDYKNTSTPQQLPERLAALTAIQQKVESSLNISQKSKGFSDLNNGQFLQSLHAFTQTKAPNSQTRLEDPSNTLQTFGEGTDCDQAMNGIANYYKTASSTLQMAATEMVKTLNDSEKENQLPAAVTRLNATEDYAGGYSVDLAKIPMEKNLRATVTGNVELKAGANDRYVVFEVAANNVNFVAEKNSGNAQISASAKMIGDLAQEKLTSQQAFDIGFETACEKTTEGRISFKGTANETASIAAGKTPSLSEQMTIKGAVNSGCADMGKGSMTFDAAADFKATQTTPDTMTVSLAVNLAAVASDGKTQNIKNKFDFVMTRDKNGTCLVSQANMNGKPLNRSNGRGGIKR